ncbi:MAG: cobalamin biosynthesis protein CobQ, partial [Huintestinicola sp.]
IVNNTNLGFETDEKIIHEGLEKAERFSEMTGVPIFCSTVPVIDSCKDIDRGKLFPINIYIRNAWN